MPDYLLDCNHFSAALRKVSPVRERIHKDVERGTVSYLVFLYSVS